jgi:hypothetical protein
MTNRNTINKYRIQKYDKRSWKSKEMTKVSDSFHTKKKGDYKICDYGLRETQHFSVTVTKFMIEF